MERRRAVTAATAASITFFLAAAGLTANATILGAREADGIGTIRPVPELAVPAGATHDPGPTAAGPTTSADRDGRPSAPTASHTDGDDDEHEHVTEAGEHGDGGHEATEHEGGDDDD
jgi:hypothetical protein